MYAPSTFSGRFAEKPIELTPSRLPGTASVSPSMGIRQLAATKLVSALKLVASPGRGMSLELLIDAVRGMFTNRSPVVVAAAGPHVSARPLAMAAVMRPSLRAVRRLISRPTLSRRAPGHNRDVGHRRRDRPAGPVDGCFRRRRSG